jgi:hypothetical protein
MNERAAGADELFSLGVVKQAAVQLHALASAVSQHAQASRRAMRGMIDVRGVADAQIPAGRGVPCLLPMHQGNRVESDSLVCPQDL